MDWVHAEAAPRFPGDISQPGSSGLVSDAGSPLLSPTEDAILPELDVSWGSQEIPSPDLGWQAPSSNLTGWETGSGSPRDVGVISSNIALAAASGVVEGLGDDVVDPPRPPSLTAAQPAGEESALLAHIPRNGSGHLPAPSYSSGAMFESEHGSGMFALGVGGQGVMGSGGIGAQLEGEGAAASMLPIAGVRPSTATLHSVITADAAAVAARSTPKKKARGPRAPKKKAKAPAAPIRRALKIKKPRSAEVPLGENGRERAMNVLRMLVDSPLSEEFHKPVLQLHPELAERYQAVVRRPIDLTKVARRLRRGVYDDAAGRLRRDIVRIFKNCEKFNLGTNQLFVGIARHLRALFESQWAEVDLPVPGETRAVTLRRRAALRSARYRLCWGTQLRGPLREAARQAVRATSKAALGAGIRGAIEIAREFSEEILPMLSGDGDPTNEEWTLGLFAERACLALGLRAHQPPPESPDDNDDGYGGGGVADEEVLSAIGFGSSGASLALSNGNEKAGRDACADWLFGPQQDAWLMAETAPGKNPPAAASTAIVSAAWRALDRILSPATVLVASHASRGSEFSSVWARPDKLVWAKQAKNVYWPAMLLWGSGTTAALREVNVGRVPQAFREELEKQAKGNNRGGAVVEFFGAHEFALLKPDALRPMMSLDKTPNKSLSKNKRWKPTMEEAVRAVAALGELEKATYQAQPELARALGFALDSPNHEEEAPDSDSGSSSGESVLESDSEYLSDHQAPQSNANSGSPSAGASQPDSDHLLTPTAAAISPPWGSQPPDYSPGEASTSSTSMSPPPPPSRLVLQSYQGGVFAGVPQESAGVISPAGAVGAAAKLVGGGAKPSSANKRKRKPSDGESKRPPKKKPTAVGGSSNSSSSNSGSGISISSSSISSTVGGLVAPTETGLTVSPEEAVVTATTAMPEPSSAGVNNSLGAIAPMTVSGIGLEESVQREMAVPTMAAVDTAGETEEASGGAQEEMTKKERALEKVMRYLDKYGDLFLRPQQRKALATVRDREKSSSLRAKGQSPQSAPPTLAASAVLGQTGLWGRLMGGPDNTKAPLEETESTDDEDEDVGTIDSETSNKRADRKAALRRQQHLLREDIENLHARALQQEKRLRGLGATIPMHAALQTKRDRERREFLAGRANNNSNSANKAKREDSQGFRGENKQRSATSGSVSTALAMAASQPNRSPPKPAVQPIHTSPSPSQPQLRANIVKVVTKCVPTLGGGSGVLPAAPSTNPSFSSPAPHAATTVVAVNAGTTPAITAAPVKVLTAASGNAFSSPGTSSSSKAATKSSSGGRSSSGGSDRAERSGSGRAYGSSSFRGVNLNGNRWLARISQDGKKKSLGGYATEEEAAKAYDRAALQLFGPSAVTNFKDGKRVHPEKGASSRGGGSKDTGGASKANGMAGAGVQRALQTNSDRGTVQVTRIVLKPPTLGAPSTISSSPLENGIGKGPVELQQPQQQQQQHYQQLQQQQPRAKSVELSPSLTPSKRRLSPEKTVMPNKHPTADSSSPSTAQLQRDVNELFPETDGSNDRYPVSAASPAAVPAKMTSDLSESIKNPPTNNGPTAAVACREANHTINVGDASPGTPEMNGGFVPAAASAAAQLAGVPMSFDSMGVPAPSPSKPVVPSPAGQLPSLLLSQHQHRTAAPEVEQRSPIVVRPPAPVAPLAEPSGSPAENKGHGHAPKAMASSGDGGVGTPPSGSSIPPGYMQMFSSHGTPAYGRPGYRGAVGGVAEGAVWPGSTGHPGFNPYSAAAAYGYPFGGPGGYGHSSQAAPGLSRTEATYGGHASTQRGQPPLPSLNRGISGYTNGAPAPSGGRMKGYGVYGVHSASFLCGQATPPSEAVSGSTVPPTLELSGGSGKTQQVDSSATDLAFEDNGHQSLQHISGAGRDGGQLSQQQQQLASLSNSPLRSSRMQVSGEDSPASGYSPTVLGMHARHAFAHNAHVRAAAQAAAAQAAAAQAAAAQAAAAQVAAAQAAAAQAVAAQAGGGGGGGGDILLYGHQPTPGGLYMRETHMPHHQQYSARTSRPSEPRSSSGGGGGGGGVSTTAQQQHQQQIEGLAHAAQQEAFDQFRLTARFNSHTQSQQQAIARVGQGSPGQAANSSTLQPTANLNSSSSVARERGW